ncbi:hypothetical protein APHAL10511_005866 [Amanita phalloides]|nr:hypothetical protein APHAL10511_005866 [Amanita phalloides]
MSKRVASPLSSEIDKKLKLGLTDEDVKLLNNIVGSVMKAPHYAQFNKEDVPTSALALAFQLVAIAMLSTRHAAIIDNSWVKNSAESNEQRITQLSPEEQSKLASIGSKLVTQENGSVFVDIRASHLSCGPTKDTNATPCSLNSG